MLKVVRWHIMNQSSSSPPAVTHGYSVTNSIPTSHVSSLPVCTVRFRNILIPQITQLHSFIKIKSTLASPKGYHQQANINFEGVCPSVSHSDTFLSHSDVMFCQNAMRQLIGLFPHCACEVCSSLRLLKELQFV